MKRFRLRADGTFDIVMDRRVILARAFSRASYRDALGISHTVRTTAQSGDASLRGTDGAVVIELYIKDDTLTLRCQNSSASPLSLDLFEILYCDERELGDIKLGQPAGLSYLHHGWQSWSKTEIRPVTEPEHTFDGDDFFEKHLPYGAAEPDERTSNGFILLAATGQESAALLGFETGANQFSQIRLNVRADQIARVRAISYADGAQLDAGAVSISETLMVSFGDANALYAEYVTRVARRMPRRGAHNSLQGWCSWYYYYGENTAEDVRANLNVSVSENVPLDLIVIDDGYETAIGDWTSVNADKFPAGMKQVADEIHAAGKLAGIWLAPFGALRDSLLAREHPEFFLLGADGAPVRAWSHWNQEVFALDLTRPEVLAWLGELFHTVCHEWGYDAVKLDFVFAGALGGKHYDAHATRAQAYRRGLGTIAETLGAGKIILGCGAPQLASVGLVDTMRVSQDVNFVWAPGDPANGGAVSTEFAVQNTLLRAPLNQVWWLNDPDCVIVRPRGDLNAMTRNENRTLASVAALTGSILLDSDNLATLKRSALDDLRAILPASAKTARVRRWFSESDQQPSELELELDNGTWVLAAINWSKRTREAVIRLPEGGAYHIRDFWAGRDLGVHRKRITLPKHAPHQTIVLHCIPAARSRGKIAWSTHIGAAR